MKKYIPTLSILLFCVSIASVVNAQKLNLNKGDEYKLTTAMSSSTLMKRGDKQIEYQSMSTITKAYAVTEANDNGYKLAITTKHIADTINAFNQKLAYSTSRAADPASRIETALSKMVGETQSLVLDKSGKITQVDNTATTKANEAAAAGAGVYYKLLNNGDLLNFGATFSLPANAKTGTKWNETKTRGESTEKTTYSVLSTTATTTTVSFKIEHSVTGSATNVDGVLMMDNTTGVVLQRILKFNSLSNESVDGKSYIVARKNIITEICDKVK